MLQFSVSEACSIFGIILLLFGVSLKLQSDIASKVSAVDFKEVLTTIQSSWKDELVYVRRSLHELRDTLHSLNLEIAAMKATRQRDDQLREILKEGP